MGSLEYVRSFASCYGIPGGDNIIIVKVDPAHVVSVPYDCNCQKVRVERYEVVELFTGELPETVYGNQTKEQSRQIHQQSCSEKDMEPEDAYHGCRNNTYFFVVHLLAEKIHHDKSAYRRK